MKTLNVVKIRRQYVLVNGKRKRVLGVRSDGTLVLQ